MLLNTQTSVKKNNSGSLNIYLMTSHDSEWAETIFKKETEETTK